VLADNLIHGQGSIRNFLDLDNVCVKCQCMFQSLAAYPSPLRPATSAAISSIPAYPTCYMLRPSSRNGWSNNVSVPPRFVSVAQALTCHAPRGNVFLYYM
jgi:hypothetical protein